VAAYEQAIELARRAGDRTLEAQTLIELGNAFNFYHRPDRALEHLDHALAIGREVGDRAVETMSLATIAVTRSAGFGQLRESREPAETALRLAPEIADPRARAQALVYAGVVLQWRGEFVRALEVLERGVALAEEVHAGFVGGLGVFHASNALLSLGRYEDAQARYRRLYEYAVAAGDRFALVRAANSIGAIHLELFDHAEGVRVSLESEELTQKVFPWPEPRAHAYLKVAAGHFGRGDLGLAEEFLDRAAALLEADVWGRWRWHMVLVRMRGELALARGRFDEAWGHATQAAEMAATTAASKHEASALRLQGQVLVARDRLEEAVKPLADAAALAERLGTPRERWIASAALGALAARRGHDVEAERHHGRALEAVEGIARGLTTPALRRSFLTAERVRELYRVLGRRAPDPDA
jgi:tetratricopeptide (TPR) repeat protein